MSIHNSIARKKWGYGKGLNSTTAMSIGNPRFCGRVGVGVRYEKKKIQQRKVLQGGVQFARRFVLNK